MSSQGKKTGRRGEKAANVEPVVRSSPGQAISPENGAGKSPSVNFVPPPVEVKSEEVVTAVVSGIVDSVLDKVYDSEIQFRAAAFAVREVRDELDELLSILFVRRDAGEPELTPQEAEEAKHNIVQHRASSPSFKQLSEYKMEDSKQRTSSPLSGGAGPGISIKRTPSPGMVASTMMGRSGSPLGRPSSPQGRLRNQSIATAGRPPSGGARPPSAGRQRSPSPELQKQARILPQRMNVSMSTSSLSGGVMLTEIDKEALKAWLPDDDLPIVEHDSWARGAAPVKRKERLTRAKSKGGSFLNVEKAPSISMSMMSASQRRKAAYNRRATLHMIQSQQIMEATEVAKGEAIKVDEKAEEKDKDTLANQRKAVRKANQAKKKARGDKLRREKEKRIEHEKAAKLMRELASSDYTLDHEGKVVVVSRVDPEKLPSLRQNVKTRITEPEKEEGKKEKTEKEPRVKPLKLGGISKDGTSVKGTPKEGTVKAGMTPLAASKRSMTGMSKRKEVKKGPKKIKVVTTKEKPAPRKRDEFTPIAAAQSLVSTMRVQAGVTVSEGNKRATGGSIAQKKREEGGRIRISKKEYSNFVDAQDSVYKEVVSSGNVLSEGQVHHVTSLSASLNLPRRSGSREEPPSSNVLAAQLPKPQFAKIGQKEMIAMDQNATPPHSARSGNLSSRAGLRAGQSPRAGMSPRDLQAIRKPVEGRV